MAVCAGLLAWRFETIDSPPYWDATVGLFTEADFLVDSHFDYQRLMTREKSVWDGGARSYVSSVLPSFVALLMLVCPTPRVTIIVYHLFTYACAAVVLVALFRILRPHCGAGAALLAVALTAAVPIFSTQIELLGMEMPMAAAVLMAVDRLFSRRPAAALGWTAVGYACKASGAVATVAILGLIVLRAIVVGRDRRRDERLPGAIVLGVLLVAAELFVMRHNHISSELILRDHRHELATLQVLAPLCCPDLIVLLLLAAAAALVAMFLSARGAAPASGTSGASRPGLRSWLARDDVQFVLLCWAIVLGVVLGMARVIFLPRYLLVAVPFLVAACAVPLFTANRARWKYALFAGLLVFELANQHGRFYPALAQAVAGELGRTGGLLDRSREYLADHQANLALIRRLEECCAGQPIFVPAPLTNFVTLPRLGYVQKPWTGGYLLNNYSDRVAWLRHPLAAALDDVPEAPVFIRIDTLHHRFARLFDTPEPEAGDEILYEDRRFESPLLVFRKRWGGSVPSRAEREAWYRQRLLPLVSDASRQRAVALHLVQTGQDERALPELRHALAVEPRAADLCQMLADLLSRKRPAAGASELDEADQSIRRTLALEPDEAGAWLILARVEQLQGHAEAAAAARERAARLDPERHDPFGS
ncbi:MAG: hypothetical protein K1X74_15780 [Pirellulales bacterium]|nr:hypothetical protein [Pirellulales bacterium]